MRSVANNCTTATISAAANGSRRSTKPRQPPMTAVTAVAKSFMDAFPDMVLYFERLEPAGDRINYHWRFVGTNTGPDGTGMGVDFSGYESWLMGDDGLVADSLGNFDADEYARQLANGVDSESDG